LFATVRASATERGIRVRRLLLYLASKAIGKRSANISGVQRTNSLRSPPAAIGLENLKEPCKVKLLSDSKYVVETMGGTWKRKTNHEWWSRLDKAAAKHTIEWEWVKGHSGHEIQEVADTAARKIAKDGKVDRELLDELVLSIGVLEV